MFPYHNSFNVFFIFVIFSFTDIYIMIIT
jgi:hypothetical protein